MATMIIMPKSGQSVESCVIAKWQKKKGDIVKKGDILFTYETDKASFEKESEVDGVILEIFHGEGDDVPCLENVCAIGNAGEKVENTPSSPLPDIKQETEVLLKAPTADRTANVIEPKENKSNKLFISPRARNLAARARVDEKLARGSGASGRIIERDIKDLIKLRGAEISKAFETEASVGKKELRIAEDSDASQNAFEFVKHSNIRKIIAKSMMQSLSTMAQLTLHTSFNASNILEFRKMLKKVAEKNDVPAITITDIILYACSRVLMKHKNINARYQDEGIELWNTVNLGVAVDTDRGLMVPTIFGSENKTLSDISSTLKYLASEAKNGAIDPKYLKNGTFTITTLGSLGIEMFTPVINPPQVAILGVCAMTNKLSDDASVYKSMGLSLTIDHRAVDGAPGAKFLQDLVKYLENFSVMSVL